MINVRVAYTSLAVFACLSACGAPAGTGTSETKPQEEAIYTNPPAEQSQTTSTSSSEPATRSGEATVSGTDSSTMTPATPTPQGGATQASTTTTSSSITTPEPPASQNPPPASPATPTQSEATTTAASLEAAMAAIVQSTNLWANNGPSLAPRRSIYGSPSMASPGPAAQGLPAPRRSIFDDIVDSVTQAGETVTNTITGQGGGGCPAVTTQVNLSGVELKSDYGSGCPDPLTGNTFSGSATFQQGVGTTTLTFASLSDGTRTLDGVTTIALSGLQLTISNNGNLKGPYGTTSTQLTQVFSINSNGTTMNFLDDTLTGNGSGSVVAPNGSALTVTMNNMVYAPITCPLEPKQGNVTSALGPLTATMALGENGTPYPLWCDGCGDVYVNSIKIGKVCWVGGVSFEPAIPLL